MSSSSTRFALPPQIVSRILAAVDELAPVIVDAVRSAIAIRSVTPTYPGERFADHVGAEGEVSRLIAGICADAGCDVEVFGLQVGRENCAARLPGRGRGRSLILNGHVDVVPGGAADEWADGDPWSGRIGDGRIWGRGASDMKAGLVAQAFAPAALRAAGVALRGDLIVQAVVGEECMEHELGTSACVERGYRADAAVVAEPSSPPSRLAVAPVTPGVLRFVVTVRGRRAHPAMRGSSIRAGGEGWEVAVNAIDKAFLVYQAVRLREEEWGLTKRHPLFQPGQFVIHPGVFVGSPEGQLDPFFIADRATIDYIVIYNPDDDPDEVRAEIEALVADVARLDGWLRSHPPVIEWKHHWPASVVPTGHPLVEAVAAAHELAVGQPAEVVGWSAVHDGTFLTRAGIPAVCYGPGDVRSAHAHDESVAVDEVIDAARTYALLAASWCGIA